MRIVPFSRDYDRLLFDCGVSELNHYLQRQVSQDIKRRLTSCYLALDDNDRIMGYYTLSAFTIAFDELSPNISKKLPRYNLMPAVLMGRLAVDIHYRGKNIGANLIVSALHRSQNLEIGSLFLVVEAKNEQAITFYEHFGFLRFQSVADKLYYPLSQKI